MFKTTFLLVFCVFSIDSALIYNLGGSWRVSDLNEEYKDLPALVPGGIYSDLMQNNVIGDVFSGYNDVETRWVGKRDWKYQRNFTVDQTFLSHQRINLMFDGLDTFASVRINDIEILSSDNMFVQYIVDVTSNLQAGENLIEVVFKSAIEESQRLYEEQLEDYEVFPTCVPENYNGECHVNHIRKMQASFSWDWGPALPSVGIWKPVYLEAYNSSVIRDITVDTAKSSTDSWNVALKVYFEATPNNKTVGGTIVINLDTDVTRITQLFDVVLSKNEDGEIVATLNFTIPALQVSLWWPNGYGLQNLYLLNVSFTSDEGETTSKNVKIGFRTIELIQDPIDGGRAFYFKVNNVAMFAKGTNSIPINILPERGQNETVIRFLMQSARDVHMNMLRVWGGGVYESDAFYEIADELGILVWQDFMFACSMYPTKINYLESVRREVRHQVRRLQHHASVALWAANNENEAALRDNWYGTAKNFTLYAQDYVKLYVNTVRDEALKNDDTRDFLTSSPTNGVESENEGYISENPYSLFFGDLHYYNYLLNSWNKDYYKVTRFASEYGFQAMPQLESWLSATENLTNLHPSSDFLKHRQHLPLGNYYLKLLIGYELVLPDTDSPNYVNAFVFYSQIIQAVAIKYQTEYYRQWKSIIRSDDTGLTMGALYWQLNDVWVAPTWAGIDFQNRWKMMHYYAKDFFAPIIVTGHLTSSRELDIYLVSDVLTSFYNTTLNIIVYNWSSLQPVFTQRVITDIWSNVSRKIFSIWIDSYLASFPKCKTNTTSASAECFIYFSLMDSNDRPLAPNNFVFPVTLKTASLVQPKLQISSVVQTDTSGNEFAVTVTTDVITLFVWLNSSNVNGRFSENGFLQVEANKTVNFYADVATNVQVLSESLSVTNLLDDKFL